MLLDKQGHLKLADFGTCMRMDKVYSSFLMILCKYLVNSLTDLGTCRKISMSEAMAVLLWDSIKNCCFQP